MNRHVRILAGGKEIDLPDDFALDMEWVNPLFNDNVESGSLPFNIPLEGNRHLVKNMEDVKSGVRAMDVEHTPCVVYVDDVPYHSGELVVSEDQELKDSLDASINSYIRSLDDLISDLDCQDVPVKDKIQIGECIGDLVADYEFDIQVRALVPPYVYFFGDPVDAGKLQSIHRLPVVGMSVPVAYKEADAQHINVEKDANGKVVEHDFINMTDPYPIKKYCNARVCYENTSYNDDSYVELSNPIYTLDARRPGSGVCFYVLYFLDCLFAHIGLSYDYTRLLEVEDMKRLAFYTTHCEYDTERKYDTNGYDLNGIEAINKWLSERSDDLNGKTSMLTLPPMLIDDESKMKSVERAYIYLRHSAVRPKSGGGGYEEDYPEGTRATLVKDGYITIEYPDGRIDRSAPISWIKTAYAYVSGNMRANIMKMYANSKNFPATGVANIINSLWASFGVRFVLDYERQSVKTYYIRDVMRNTSVRKLHGVILSVNKKVEKTTGFRMRYAAESDPKSQSKNVMDGVRDYETAFDYLMSASPIVHTNADGNPLSYSDLVSRTGGIADINCYVDSSTGNAYRWKVDKEATTMEEAKVNLFEVAGYKGISRGDCSKRNEDYIVDITSDFEPLVLFDVNYRNVQAGTASQESVLSAFADAKMLNERSDCELTLAMGSALMDFPVKVNILTDEKWDPSTTDEGDSPLQSYDWGTAVAVMRGGGGDAHIQYYDYDYDGFGNAKYRVVSGSYAFTSDSIDNYGNHYDYVPDESDESTDDMGDGERFSLKITAYKHDEQGNVLTDEQGNELIDSDPAIRNRGLFDTFMSEYCQFLLNRTPLVIKMLCEVAELVDIPNHWDEKWEIGEYLGWINKVKTHTTMVAGLEEVEVEMYSL